jgi:hypothetical protein
MDGGGAATRRQCVSGALAMLDHDKAIFLAQGFVTFRGTESGMEPA